MMPLIDKIYRKVRRKARRTQWFRSLFHIDSDDVRIKEALDISPEESFRANVSKFGFITLYQYKKNQRLPYKTSHSFSLNWFLKKLSQEVGLEWNMVVMSVRYACLFGIIGLANIFEKTGVSQQFLVSLAIAFDAKNNSTEQTSTSSITLSLTLGSVSNGLLVMGSSLRNSGGGVFRHITGATWNTSENLSSHVVQDGPSSARYLTAEIWSVKVPTSGTHNLVVTYAGTVDRAVIGGVHFSGVDQTTPVEASAGAQYLANPGGTGDPWTVSITTITANAWIFNVIYNASDFDTAPSNGETIAWEVPMNSNGDYGCNAGYKGPIATPASTTTGWSSGSGADEASIAGIAIKPASGSSPSSSSSASQSPSASASRSVSPSASASPSSSVSRSPSPSASVSPSSSVSRSPSPSASQSPSSSVSRSQSPSASVSPSSSLSSSPSPSVSPSSSVSRSSSASQSPSSSVSPSPSETNDGMPRKRYLYKIYEPNGDFITTWADVVSEPEFYSDINGGYSELVVRLARSESEFDENNSVDYENQLKLWEFDEDTGYAGVQIYSGKISRYTPQIVGSREIVEVTFLSYWWETQQMILENAGDTEVAYTAQDPTAILKDALDKFTASGGRLDYDGGSTDNTGLSLDYTFNTATFQEVLLKCLDLAPFDWYLRVGPNDIIYFEQKNSVADHILTLGKEISEYYPEKRTENIINTIYFVGGGSPKLYKKYVDSASVTAYGTKAIKYVDERVVDTGTSDAIKDRIFDSLSEPEIRITAKIMDNNGLARDAMRGYDIESLFVGQTVQIRNATAKTNNLWDEILWDVDSWDYDITNASSQVLQIMKVQYHPDYAIIELSNKQPDIVRRVEEINRQLVDSITADNPTAPS